MDCAVMLRAITEIASHAGIDSAELQPYGPYKAKVRLDATGTLSGHSRGQVILITGSHDDSSPAQPSGGLIPSRR